MVKGVDAERFEPGDNSTVRFGERTTHMTLEVGIIHHPLVIMTDFGRYVNRVSHFAS